MDKPATKKEIRTFGIGLAVILAVIASLSSYKHGQLRLLWLYGVSGVLLVLSLAAPDLLKPVYKTWMKVAHAIGWFNTRVLLAVIYYVVFTPISCLSRLFGQDLLDSKWEPQASTYWIEREAKQRVQKDYEKQF
jgi:hypothetical protein